MSDTKQNFLIKGHTKKQNPSKEDLENQMTEIDEQINKLLLRKADILCELKKLK